MEEETENWWIQFFLKAYRERNPLPFCLPTALPFFLSLSSMNSWELNVSISPSLFVQFCQASCLEIGYDKGIYTNKIGKC